MTQSDSILSVEHVSMIFGGLVAVNDLSFEARRGEITALIGPNGAGKTTVFNCITGFYKPTQGMMKLARRNGDTFLLERMPDFAVNRDAKVARTFQNIRLFSGLTILENLLVAQHNTLNRASAYTIGGLLGLPSYKKSAELAREKARLWLDRIGLTARADQPAGDLPYGAQRRLEIARAMCTDPELLCLDEPAAGLNPRESLELNTLLKSIRDDTGTSILLIEHDMSVVMGISDHVVVLEYGTKIADGTPAQVKNDPKVIAAYLGVDEEEAAKVAAAPAPPAASKKAQGVAPAPEAAATAAVALASAAPAAVDKADGGKAKGKQSAGSVRARPAPTAKAAPKAKAVPKTKTAALASAAKAPARAAKDDLKLIKGIGPVNEGKLNRHGVRTFAQIAAWKKADIVEAERYLEFDGRIAREDWVGQARSLARETRKAASAKGRA